MQPKNLETKSPVDAGFFGFIGFLNQMSQLFLHHDTACIAWMWWLFRHKYHALAESCARTPADATDENAFRNILRSHFADEFF